MTIPSLTAVVRTASTLQTLTLAALPHGGQRTARRNAWAATSEGVVRAQSRHEAELALTAAARPARIASAR